MSLSIAPDLWQQLCALVAEQPNGRFVLDQHEGRIVKIEWWRNQHEYVRTFQSTLTDARGRVLTPRGE